MIDRHEIRRRIIEAINKVENEDYDREDIELCGVQIRAWRTRVNTKLRHHIGYKSSWESRHQRRYHELTIDQLVEFLNNRRGAHIERTPNASNST